ncbi:MAG: hypothetical protein MI976_28160 [Pseudomonadales bacterium]|nr:hypothetical protein [Pseudomonadales bacterium]
MGDHSEFDGIDTKPESERNRVLLNLELSGNTSFIPRFFNPEDIPNADNSVRQKRDRDFEDMLALLLAEDQSYAQLYLQVAQRLDDVQRSVDLASADIARRLDESQRDLASITDSADRLADGTKVFRSEADGQVYRETGESLSPAELGGLEISDNAPSYEDYLEANQKLLDLQRQKSEIEDYQKNVLDPIRARMNDRDDPPSREELEDALERLESKHMPELVRAYDESNPRGHAPDVHAEFARVNFDVPTYAALSAQEKPDQPHAVPSPVS